MENLFTLPKRMIALGTLIFLFACSSDEMNTGNLQTNSTLLLSGKANTDKLLIFKGPEVQFGHGKVRSWISITKDGEPMEIGFELTPELLMYFDNLDHHKEAEEITSDKHTTVIVPLHLKAQQLTPFNHLEINWNPEGHPDPFFYKPHFDFHFYMISVAEQMAIPEWSDETNEIFNKLPATCFQPAGYGTIPGEVAAVAQMGKHWLPFFELGPVFSFSKVIIYGSYDGKFNFIEPMITLDYLLSNEDFSGSYNQPSKFQKTGNYPTKYNISHNENGNIKIYLSDFIKREKSETCD